MTRSKLELIARAVIVFVAVAILVSAVVAAVAGQPAACDMYQWTPMRDVPLGCLREVGR